VAGGPMSTVGNLNALAIAGVIVLALAIVAWRCK
jgi:hypothetical protein